MLVSDVDFGHLRELLVAARRFLAKNHEHLQSLEENLTRALVVTRDQVPQDVIAIHTQVRIHELDIGRQSVYTLVLPGEADVAATGSRCSPRSGPHSWDAVWAISSNAPCQLSRGD